MNPADYSVAWEHPPTRRAWWKQLVLCLISPVAWIALWFALLAVLVVFMPEGYGYSILFAPFLIYSFYRAYIQLFYIAVVWRTRRVLRVYPWHLFTDSPNGLGDRTDVVGQQCGWFEFPNPARPEEQLPMVFPSHWAVGWWHRRMAPRTKAVIKAQIRVVWLAGDPRFIGVIAAPTSNGTAPRRFRFLTQQMEKTEGYQSVTDWGATAEDIERGRRAGVNSGRS
ncbi:hypothetical protein ACIQOU_20995 [Streptomyces sp. NPDC091279]|uniref:hypothetical protein n=1 Tax=Streptomyces sp. NPDC091279 TaxID=3365983 RepID=UPI003802ACFD